MSRKHALVLGISAPLALTFLAASHDAFAQKPPAPLTRIAELEIDPAQLDAYKAALSEEISASIKLEPGVLTLYAVSLKDNPAQIRLFETYASTAAYQSHLKTPHFLKYKNATQGMVRSLKLVETDPILLGAKSK